MRKLFTLALVAAMVTTTLIGCGKTTNNDTPKTTPEVTEAPATDEATTEAPEADDSSTQERKTLNVAYMPNYASLSAVVAAINSGAFEEEGFDINLIEFADGPTIISALESGSIDFGYIGQGAHKLAIQEKATIFCFDHYENAGAMIGNKANGVNSIDDLKGKTIAMATGTSSEFLLDLTLNKAGLTREDVKIMDMDASAIVTAMISGSVDAGSTWSPNTSVISEELGENAVIVSSNETFIDVAPFIASWVITPSYAENNQETILKFTRALYKGMDYRAEHIGEVIGWVAETAALDVNTMLGQKDDGVWDTEADIVNMINDGALQETYEVQQQNFISNGVVTDQVALDKYILFQNMLDAAQ